MSDDRRLTTDRFYGGTINRLDLLKQFLSFVKKTPVSRSEAQDWLLSNTQARSRDAINHHLGFLNAIELIDITDDTVSLGNWGRQYLTSPEPPVLYESLRSNVKGFDTIVHRMQDGPMTDEDIRDLLVGEFEDINMGTPQVAARHREWLQVLGYVERSDGVNRLTADGRQLAESLGDETPLQRAKRRTSTLRGHLLATDMSCVPDGRQSVSDVIYPSVESTHPELCDDDFLCSEAHETGRDHPEWKHVIQEALQQLADRDSSRVHRLDDRGVWLFRSRTDTPPSDGLGSDEFSLGIVSEGTVGLDDIELPGGSATTDRRSTSRDDVVRDEELVRKLKALYDDTCQICGDRRRKGPDNGFSHVRHLMPLGEPHNGPDVPQNVMVVCPNHHEDFENGMLSIDPQTLEVDHVYEDSVTGRKVDTKNDHEIGPQYVAYHNQVIALGED